HDDRNALANALDEAWQPRFSSDDIALSPLGKVLAIAERLDTLAGGFAAGLKPTGNKDPFALRRNALGLARTIIESGFDLKLLTPKTDGDSLSGTGLLQLGFRAIFAATGKASMATLQAASGEAKKSGVSVRDY